MSKWYSRLPREEEATASVWRWCGCFAWLTFAPFPKRHRPLMEIRDGFLLVAEGLQMVGKVVAGFVLFGLLTIFAPITWPLLALWRRWLSRRFPD